MIFFNGETILNVGVAVIVGFGANSLLRSPSLSLAIGCGGMTAYDLWCRLKNSEEDVPIIHPNAGGHLSFIPMWIVGIGGAIGGIIGRFVN